MINGSRVEKVKAELLSKQGTKKCDIEILTGTIECDSALQVAKGGTVTFLYPNSTRLVEDNPPNTDVIIASATGKKYFLGVDVDGTLQTYEVQENSTGKLITGIKVEDDGTLYTENVSSELLVCTLMDLNGYTWNVGIEATGVIYTESSGEDRKVYYRKEKIEINYLTDRLKIYFGIDDAWYVLGEFMMIKPKRTNDIISTPLHELTTLIKKQIILDPVVFLKGTSYHEVLSYFVISSGFTKINIEATDLTLQSDRVFDDSKNKLDWFNEVAKEINYTNLTVDDKGYFTSKKYAQPTLSSVTHTYRVDDKSIIVGEFDIEQDITSTYNVIKCVHSNPNTALMVSIARNDNPSDMYSTYNIGEVPLIMSVNNVADKQELDGIATRTLFENRQITQSVSFDTLINPTHGLNNVLQIISNDISGVLLESKWSIPLEAGALMKHTAKRLVDVRSVVI